MHQDKQLVIPWQGNLPLSCIAKKGTSVAFKNCSLVTLKRLHCAEPYSSLVYDQHVHPLIRVITLSGLLVLLSLFSRANFMIKQKLTRIALHDTHVVAILKLTTN